jgi:2-polyprenyl-6-hydroxyphenyl methylase / 3-demethylubiquinone-9 3-methyltransferase
MHTVVSIPCKNVRMENGSPSDSSSRPFSSNSSSSVSSQEVTKFSGMDDTWWDPRKNPLVSMNPIRVHYILDTLKRFKSLNDPPLLKLKALDVGCGGGLLSESLARLGASVTAIDPSTPLVERAQQHAIHDPRTKSIDYRGGVALEDLSDEQYDIICILEVIEHATDADSIFQAAASLLKPDGVLYISTMNRTWKSYALAIIGAEYVMGYLPIGTHDWNRFLSPQEVEERIKRANLKAVDVSGMIMTAPRLDGTWGWRLDPKDTDVNWIGAYRQHRP